MLVVVILKYSSNANENITFIIQAGKGELLKPAFALNISVGFYSFTDLSSQKINFIN